MNQSLSSSFDSTGENSFFNNDSQLIIQNNFLLDNPGTLVQEIQNIKRSNIMILLKIIIKELFKHRSKVLLTAECKVYFDHLFVCLENCLQHGLKPRKQIFGLKNDIWTIIELIGKYSNDAQDTIESARHLPKIRTSLGRARAWFRLTLMKKQLSDFFQLLLDHRDTILKEYYETNALMLSDDANILCGLLVGLNSFDYNIYIKEEIFDFFEPVIDLRLYLKYNYDNTSINSPEISINNQINGEEIKIQHLLDQNNYIEQVNQRLESTIKTMEQKIESLTTDCLQQSSSLKNDPKAILEFGTLLAEKEKQILEETRLKNELEKRLNEEIKCKEESEMARNLLETDIQEKQDTIITLRSQLDEVKTINIQLFNKLQEREAELKTKTVHLSETELKNEQLINEIKQLEKNIHKKNKDIFESNSELIANKQQLIDLQQEQMTQMQLELENIKNINANNNHLQEAYNLLKKKYEENELALEEIGKQLQDAKLEIESLREYNGHLKEAAWTRDSEVDKCRLCEQKFTISKRKHHCRSCGEIFCHNCSNNEMPLPSNKNPVRVCDNCHAFLLERFSKSSTT